MATESYLNSIEDLMIFSGSGQVSLLGGRGD